MAVIKKVNLDQDVARILADMEWSQEGGEVIGRITEQLDRPTYNRVNKALTQLKGKWNRRRKGHVFLDDPRPAIQAALGEGVLEVVKDGYFPTPRPVALRLLALANVDTSKPLRVLEPSAGEGHLADVVREELQLLPSRIEVYETHPRRRQILADKGYLVVGEDFMKAIPDLQGYDLVVMNPPFERGQDVRHVERAYEMLAPGGVLVAVMSAGIAFREQNPHRRLRERIERSGGCIEPLPSGSFEASGTGVETVLVRMNG